MMLLDRYFDGNVCLHWPVSSIRLYPLRSTGGWSTKRANVLLMLRFVYRCTSRKCHLSNHQVICLSPVQPISGFLSACLWLGSDIFVGDVQEYEFCEAFWQLRSHFRTRKLCRWMYPDRRVVHAFARSV